MGGGIAEMTLRFPLFHLANFPPTREEAQNGSGKSAACRCGLFLFLLELEP